MNENIALQFLERHQPMPSDSEVSEKLITTYDEVIKYFAEHPNPLSVRLLLNSFGIGSGYGVYQLVEDTLLKQNHCLVVDELVQALQSKIHSVRSWCTEISAVFPSEKLIEPLTKILFDDDDDMKYSAIVAIGRINSIQADEVLHSFVKVETNSELKELALEILEERM